MDWQRISTYQHLTEGLMQKYSALLDLDAINDNWLYKNESELETAVRRTGLYDCHEDYFIAYKDTRGNRNSKFNFLFRYRPGETYETFADVSGDENSFGFSVWTKKGAASHCGELVVACKVYYRDVARVVHGAARSAAGKSPFWIAPKKITSTFPYGRWVPSHLFLVVYTDVEKML